MIIARTVVGGLLAVSGLAVAACQTAPAPDAGFLASYDGLTKREDTVRASIRERRDDAAMTAVTGLFIEPAVLAPGAGDRVAEADARLVLGEIDRQICFELSERFDIADRPSPQVGRVRTAVTRISPTHPAGSALSAATKFFIPGPVGVRAPGSTGGLAVESEVLGPDGRQLAALAWARNATVVGMDDPSLSAVGDALQFAEPFGDQVGDSFAPEDRAVRDIPKPDPCARFGSRSQAGAMVAGFATGLYIPQTAGVKPQAAPETTED